MAHTPGPWKVMAGDDYEVVSAATPEEYPHGCKDDDLGRFVAQVGNRGSRHGEDDALLIAAAPDLLVELKAVQQQCLFGDDDGGIGVSEDVVIPSEMFDRMCAAINKAEGRDGTQ